MSPPVDVTLLDFRFSVVTTFAALTSLKYGRSANNQSEAPGPCRRDKRPSRQSGRGKRLFRLGTRFLGVAPTLSVYVGRKPSNLSAPSM